MPLERTARIPVTSQISRSKNRAYLRIFLKKFLEFIFKKLKKPLDNFSPVWYSADSQGQLRPCQTPDTRARKGSQMNPRLEGLTTEQLLSLKQQLSGHLREVNSIITSRLSMAFVEVTYKVKD